MNRKVLSAIILIAAASNATAQKLTLGECLKIGIESNYNVKIADNNRRAADNNVIPSPFLPVITASARQTHDEVYNTDHNRDNTIADQNRDYNTNNSGADLSLNWTLFDGMNMFATYQTQKELLKVGELALRNSMEQLVTDISAQYYYIVTQKMRCNLARRYLEISTQRYNQAREKYMLKTISGLDMTQAKMDFNADSSKLLIQQVQLENAFIQLYELMNIDLASYNDVSDTIVPNGALSLPELIETARDNNTSILMLKRGETLSELDLRIARSQRYPTLTLGSGYRFSNANISSSNLQYTRTNGVNVGLTLSAKLFNGGEVNRRIRNAQIGIDNSVLKTKDAELGVISDISQLYNTYRNNFMMISFEDETSAAALQNLEAAVTMYQIGSMSGVEFREIQRSFLEAEERRLTAIYQAKVSEISLKYLSGEILQ